MAKVTDFKRLNKDDFAEDDKDMIDKMSYVMTPFLEQVSNAFNKGIDFDNLNQHYTTVDVLAVGGVPTTQTQIKHPLKSRVKGILVISAQNLTDSTGITAAPFITYTLSTDLLTIVSITGLPDNKKFRISVILIG